MKLRKHIVLAVTVIISHAPNAGANTGTLSTATDSKKESTIQFGQRIQHLVFQLSVPMSPIPINNDI